MHILIEKLRMTEMLVFEELQRILGIQKLSYYVILCCMLRRDSTSFLLLFKLMLAVLEHCCNNVRNLLKCYLSNFVDSSVLRSCSDITTINYGDISAQVSDSELAIGTSTRMLLCGKLEDEIVGTPMEARFYKSVRTFCETSVSKILAKFPFNDNTLKKLQFLDPRKRFNMATADVLDLAGQFTSYTDDDIDSLTMDYRSCTDDELPHFDHHSDAAIDHFWADVGDVNCY